MAFWGIAFASGPNYNKAWKFFDLKDKAFSIKKAGENLRRARELMTSATSVEQGLVHALTARFPSVGDVQPDFAYHDRMYADAMRAVHRTHPDDITIAALYAEALMCITPRGLWDLQTGHPTGPHTLEARRVIERAFQLPGGYCHPALCHLHIHLLEMSPFPELALPAADRLRTLVPVPDASHMMHMPTHIDAAIGDYRRSIESNQLAIFSDDKYFSHEKASVFYNVNRAHYVMAKMYAAMMSGRFTDAISAAEKLEEIIDLELLSVPSPPIADFIESFLGSKAHVLIRFGRWDDVLKLDIPEPSGIYCATKATILYAQGVAFSALDLIHEAEARRKLFEAARAHVPESRLNTLPFRQIDILGVASAMLAGELEYRKGNFDAAFALLREAVKREDALPYTDPPSWMQPVRHALGALLLEQGHIAEATRAYKEDLGFAEGFPRRRARLNNVWGLQGLLECLVRSNKLGETLYIQSALDIAKVLVDVPIQASCYCRLTTGVDCGGS